MGALGGKPRNLLKSAPGLHTATRVAKFPQATAIRGSFPVPKRTPQSGRICTKVDTLTQNPCTKVDTHYK